MLVNCLCFLSAHIKPVSHLHPSNAIFIAYMTILSIHEEIKTVSQEIKTVSHEVGFSYSNVLVIKFQ